MDVDSTFTMRCEASGLPRPTYTWLKDGRPLTSVPGDLEVTANVLTFGVAHERHQGMYQCLASNTWGSAVSSAQVRVLSKFLYIFIQINTHFDTTFPSYDL